MSLSHKALFVACCSLVLHSNGIGAAGSTEKPSGEQLLSHPEVQGALSAIDAWVEGVQTYQQVPGISAGLVVDQQLIWNRGYGYSNLKSERPADVDTLYSICSISKLFTSIGVMQLRDAGKLTLRDSVNEHLDWFDIEQAYDDSGPINIESLLTHSSGLPRESDFSYWSGSEFPFPTREQMMERLKSQKTLYPAQRNYQYSNLAMTLLGEIVQERSGQDYQAYIQAKILAPLGLTNTRTYYPEDKHGKELAIGYIGMTRSGIREPAEPFFTRGMTAAAGFTSSVRDLAKFASWQFRILEEGGDEVLDVNTLREMHRVHWVDPDWKTISGLGFAVDREDDKTFIGHGGGCPGYITEFSMIPQEKIAAVILTNAGDSPAYDMAHSVLKVLSAALKSAESPAKVDQPDLSMYEGNYDMTPWGGEMAIRQWGEHLVTIDIPSDDLSESLTRFKSVGDHRFIRLTDDDELRDTWVFEMRADGKAGRVLVHSTYWPRINE